MAQLFSTQELRDIARAFDEYLELIYEDFYDAEDTERAYIRRIAKLFYVFTGRDWQAASGVNFTKGGNLGLD